MTDLIMTPIRTTLGAELAITLCIGAFAFFCGYQAARNTKP